MVWRLSERAFVRPLRWAHFFILRGEDRKKNYKRLQEMFIFQQSNRTIFLVKKLKGEMVMKKILSFIIALIICLSMCSCGGMTEEKALKKADELVAQWNTNVESACGYSSKYSPNETGGPVYTVYARYVDSAINSTENPEYMKNVITKEIFNNLYPQITELLEQYDIYVIFIISNQNGTKTHAGISDGKITKFD